jgi:putative transposase
VEACLAPECLKLTICERRCGSAGENDLRASVSFHVHAHIAQRVCGMSRHCGREHLILERRHELYERARDANPERWSRSTWNWSAVGIVVLNPERPAAHAVTQAARQLP